MKTNLNLTLLTLGIAVRWRMLTRLMCGAVLALPALGAHAGAVLTTLYAFTNQVNGVFADNVFPQSGLVFGGDGNLYGTTSGGYGFNLSDPNTIPPEPDDNAGAVFEISTNGLMINVFAFNSVEGEGNPLAVDGAGPVAGLVQAPDGSFYGTTEFGGQNNGGTVFKFSPTGVLTPLHVFTGVNDGTLPIGGLAYGRDGYFYGTTFRGARSVEGSLFNSTWGSVFKMDTNGTLTTLYDFTNGVDGVYPSSALTQGSDGYFYGTASQGGVNTNGTVFRVSSNGSFSILYSFGGGNDGAQPVGPLLQLRDGYFYGTTCHGGTNGMGTVFKISTNGTLTSLYSFTGANGDLNPCEGLAQGSDGYLYGTTCGPLGTELAGNVFQISTNGAYSSLYTFTNGNDGGVPECTLVQGSDGTFYGTTALGGQFNWGTVFRLAVLPTPQAMALIGNTLSLTWSGEVGGRYQLQGISDLSSGVWANIGSAITATNSTISYTDSVTNAPQRFYRLTLSQ